MTWLGALKALIERGAFHDSPRYRRLAFIVVALCKRHACRMGEFHVVMNTEHAIEEPLAGPNMKSVLHAAGRKVFIHPDNVSKNLQRNMFFTDQLHTARLGAGFLAAIEAESMPAPEVLFPNGIVEVAEVARVVDEMLGGAENSPQEDEIGAMQHFWGRQIHQMFAAQKELRESIRHGDGEAVDMLIHYLLPMMKKSNKSNYVTAFVRHIIRRSASYHSAHLRRSQQEVALEPAQICQL